MQNSDLKQRQKSSNKQQNGEKRSAAEEKKKKEADKRESFSPDAKLCVSLICLALSLLITWSVHFFSVIIKPFPLYKCVLHLSSQAASSAERQTSRNDGKVRVSAGEEPQCSGARRQTDSSLSQGLWKYSENTHNSTVTTVCACLCFSKTFTHRFYKTN